MSAAARERLRRVLEERVLLLDGGLGSLLISMGLESGRASDTWNLEHPERVVEAHRRYVEAGSDLIHTNTFGATPIKLAAAGLEGHCPPRGIKGGELCREVNAAAVELARRAARPETFVAGDLGPTGKMLPPVGDASEEELHEAFDEQTAALAQAGVDLFSIETMYDLREARAALAAALATGLPVFASMTFEARPRGHFTIMGERIVPSLGALARAGATAVGFNCSVVAAQMVGMVREAREAIDVALLAQPNAGQPRATGNGVVYDATPEGFAREVLDLVDAGARLVGGCCGTDPDFIRAARRVLDERGTP